MKNVTKKLLLMGGLCLLLASMVPSIPVQAATKAKTTKKTATEIDQTYGNVHVDVYYQRIVLKGSSAAVKKINAALKKDSDEFLASEPVTDVVDYAKSVDYVKSDVESEISYYYFAESDVSYNKNGVISVRVTTYWYAGGVSNIDVYGLTFDLKTGKKLKLNQVCTNSASKVASTLKKKIEKEDSSLDTSKITKSNVKNLSFYLESGNKAVVCFEPYELGPGGWCRMYTVKSKYK